jgi:hypothetical protein
MRKADKTRSASHHQRERLLFRRAAPSLRDCRLSDERPGGHKSVVATSRVVASIGDNTGDDGRTYLPRQPARILVLVKSARTYLPPEAARHLRERLEGPAPSLRVKLRPKILLTVVVVKLWSNCGRIVIEGRTWLPLI